MTEVEYARRITEVEAYYDRRMFAADYSERLYPPDAEFVLRFICEVIESDVYAMDRPTIDTGRPWMDDLLRVELARWDALWGTDDRSR